MKQQSFDFLEDEEGFKDTVPEVGDPLPSFVLLRLEDESGISGTGLIAEGVIFTSGKVAMSWLTDHSSIGIYDSIGEVQNIHGHSGKTLIIYKL